MAVFENNPEEWQRLDWQILQNGWTSLYWQQSILDKDPEWFKKENYNIVDFDCTEWADTNQIHKDLKKQLDFPDYYGENLNALNDCLSDLEINETGLVIVQKGYKPSTSTSPKKKEQPFTVVPLANKYLVVYKCRLKHNG